MGWRTGTRRTGSEEVDEIPPQASLACLATLDRTTQLDHAHQRITHSQCTQKPRSFRLSLWAIGCLVRQSEHQQTSSLSLRHHHRGSIDRVGQGQQDNHPRPPSIIMGDPLSVLREFVSSGRKWKEEGDEVVFGDVRFKKEEETAWRPANRQGTLSSVH